jgi:four helix bundle protein
MSQLLMERTISFASNAIAFAKTIKESTISRPLISQLVRSSTSVGANYHEACDAQSKKDFVHKIGISRKEAREVMYWLQIIVGSFPEYRENAQPLLKESNELNRILSSIILSSNKNTK